MLIATLLDASTNSQIGGKTLGLRSPGPGLIDVLPQANILSAYHRKVDLYLHSRETLGHPSNVLSYWSYMETTIRVPKPGVQMSLNTY